MARYFNILELTHSDKADILHIDNTPSDTNREHLEELMDTLDSLRAFYGKPIKITSGYRCPQLNKAVKGSATSVHMIGYAADMKPTKDTLDHFIEVVLEWAKEHKFDQIILEKNSKGSRWVHLGLYNNKGEQRGEIKKMFVKD